MAYLMIYAIIIRVLFNPCLLFFYFRNYFCSFLISIISIYLLFVCEYMTNICTNEFFVFLLNNLIFLQIDFSMQLLYSFCKAISVDTFVQLLNQHHFQNTFIKFIDYSFHCNIINDALICRSLIGVNFILSVNNFLRQGINLQFQLIKHLTIFIGLALDLCIYYILIS